MNELDCLVCGRHLQPAMSKSDYVNQPYDATTFTTHGQYGSTQFDEFDGTMLEINVCSLCLADRAERGRVLLVTPRRVRQPDPVKTKWKAPSTE